MPECHILPIPPISAPGRMVDGNGDGPGKFHFWAIFPVDRGEWVAPILCYCPVHQLTINLYSAIIGSVASQLISVINF